MQRQEISKIVSNPRMSGGKIVVSREAGVALEAGTTNRGTGALHVDPTNNGRISRVAEVLALLQRNLVRQQLQLQHLHHRLMNRGSSSSLGRQVKGIMRKMD